MTAEEAKRRHKHMDNLFWAGAIIVAGVVFLAQSLEILPEIGDGYQDEWWIWVFLGAGAWAFVLNLFQLLSPDWPNPRAWDYIWTAIFLGVGLGSAVTIDVEGSVIAGVVLVAIGAILLANLLRGQTEKLA
jgi:hypothetical protein